MGRIICFCFFCTINSSTIKIFWSGTIFSRTSNKPYIGPQIDTLRITFIYKMLSLEKIILQIKCKYCKSVNFSQINSSYFHHRSWSKTFGLSDSWAIGLKQIFSHSIHKLNWKLNQINWKSKRNNTHSTPSALLKKRKH